MKINKRIWLVLGIAIFVIVAFILYQRYSGQVSQQAEVKSKLSTAQDTVGKLTTEESALAKQIADLESQLAQARLSLNAAEASFPELVESIEYDEILFSIADDYTLAIASLTASAPSSRTEGNSTYSATSFTVRVEGKASELMLTTSSEHRQYIYQTVGNILSFVNRIAYGEDFTAATVGRVTTSIPEPLTESEIDTMRTGIRNSLTKEETTGKSVLEIEQLIGNKLTNAMAQQKPSATIEVSIYGLSK